VVSGSVVAATVKTYRCLRRCTSDECSGDVAVSTWDPVSKSDGMPDTVPCQILLPLRRWRLRSLARKQAAITADLSPKKDDRPHEKKGLALASTASAKFVSAAKTLKLAKKSSGPKVKS
jgi:hypothetical protein